MTGEYTISIESPRLSYKITVNRKYTFVQGDSGTGKTRFAECLLSDTEYYKISCSVPVYVIPNASLFEDYVAKPSDKECILIIDENACSSFYRNDKCHEFAKLSFNMSAYFILITRLNFTTIPYSPESIFIFENIGKGNKLINKAVKRYTWEDDIDVMLPDSIIVEDLKAGYKFYKNTLSCDVVTADGNSNISDKIIEEVDKRRKNIFVIGDGAGIGPHIRNIIREKKALEEQGRNVKLFFPESFEYLVLLALLGGIKELTQTYDYADSQTYKSWEDYYTKLLRHVTERYGGYKKGVLPNYLKGRKFITKFYKNIEDLDKSCIKD